jgi:asparagine synthetase B (glutamine-hydrolysing)
MTEPGERHALRFTLVITRDPARWRHRLQRVDQHCVELPCAGGVALLHCTHADAVINAHDARLLIGYAQSGARSEGNFAALTVEAAQATVQLNATSTQWVCYAARGDALIISDDLPALCALLAPVAPDPAMLLHHLAFRRYPAGRTYIDGVRRLVPGETLRIDADAWTVRLTQPLASLMPARQTRIASVAAIDGYDHALERAVAQQLDQPAMLLLSGGVDSNLIGASLRSCSYRVPTPEFDAEVLNVRDAQTALSADHLFVDAGLENYADGLARTIAAIGGPVSEEQIPCFLALVEHASAHGELPARYLSGEGSDDTLGIPGAKRWLQLDIARHIPGARVISGVAGRVFAHALPDKAHGLRELAALLPTLKDRLDPLHPANDYGYGNWAVLERAFGRAALRAAIAERVAVLDAHLAGRSLPLVEYVHHLDLLNEMSQSEALTTMLFARHGLSLRSPFMDSGVVRAAFVFNARIRFHHNDETKWLPRALLRKRGFESLARVKKQHGGFPDRLMAMLTRGPLADLLRSQPRPDWLDTHGHRQLLEHPDGLSWNVLTWGMFEAWLTEVNRAAHRREQAPVNASAPDRSPDTVFHPAGGNPP